MLLYLKIESLYVVWRQRRLEEIRKFQIHNFGFGVLTKENDEEGPSGLRSVNIPLQFTARNDVHRRKQFRFEFPKFARNATRGKHAYRESREEHSTQPHKPIHCISVDSGIRASHVMLRNVSIEPGNVFSPEHSSNVVGSEHEARSDGNGQRLRADSNPYSSHSKDDGMSDVVVNHGHGTFVASIVAKAAKESEIDITFIPLVVVNRQGRGDSYAVMRAVKWAIDHRRRYHNNQPSILLFALAERQQHGMEWLWTKLTHQFAPEPLDEAFRLADENAFISIVAAGNFNSDACYNRKSLPLPTSVLVVGAAHEKNRAPYSNYGDCVNVFAPGGAIGASAMGDSQVVLMVGTSTGVPLVAKSLIEFWSSQAQGEATAISTCAIAKRFFDDRSLIHPAAIEDLRCELAEDTRACEGTSRHGLIVR